MAVREVDERKIDTTINSSGSLEDGPRMDRSREFATKVTLWHQFRALVSEHISSLHKLQLLNYIILHIFNSHTHSVAVPEGPNAAVASHRHQPLPTFDPNHLHPLRRHHAGHLQPQLQSFQLHKPRNLWLKCLPAVSPRHRAGGRM